MAVNKIIYFIAFFIALSFVANAQTTSKRTLPTKKVSAPIKSETKKSITNSKEIKPVQKTVLNKNPRAIFLIKRAKVDSDIGEPVLYPYERQLSNLYFDVPVGDIRNE